MMALSEGMDWKELGLLIGHEAYRDGIVSDEQTQKEETREAVKGHTEMAEKMLGDVLYASSMSQLIDNNQNLQVDLLARVLGEDFFNAYIDGTYDSSADYWRMTCGGQLISDKDGWLKDENGWYINADGTHTEELQDNTLGAAKQESGLLNIINGTSGQKYDTFTEEQKQQVQAIMTSAGMSMDSNGQWEITLGRNLNMYNVMTVAGENIADVVFKQYYNNKVDYDIAQAWQMDLQFSNTAMNKEVPDSLVDKYSNLVTEHLQDTSTPAALKNKYMWTIYDEKGVGINLFKIDENNSYFDDLIKQTNPRLYSTINDSGCNYMSTIAFPQLLTGNILTPAEINNLWNYGTNQISPNDPTMKWIRASDSYVREPDKIANYLMRNLGNSSLKFQFGKYGTYNDYNHVGQLIGVPYGGINPGHWTLGNNSQIYYNPANSTGTPTIKEVYVHY